MLSAAEPDLVAALDADDPDDADKLDARLAAAGTRDKMLIAPLPDVQEQARNFHAACSADFA
jgi:hypothetical protein